MIAADVGHTARVETDAGDACLVQGMARYFHHRMRASVADHAGHQRCEPIGRGRGQCGIFDIVAVEIAQGSYQPDFVSRLHQHTGQEATGGRFSVGPGNADDL